MVLRHTAFQKYYLSLPKIRYKPKTISYEETHVTVAIRGIVDGLLAE